MPTPIAKTSPQKTIPQRMSRKYILSQCFYAHIRNLFFG